MTQPSRSTEEYPTPNPPDRLALVALAEVVLTVDEGPTATDISESALHNSRYTRDQMQVVTKGVAKDPDADLNRLMPIEGEDQEGSEELDDSWDKEAPMPDLIRLYLTDIGRVALLTAEQEVDLAKNIEAGVLATEKIRQAETREIAKLKPKLRRDLEVIAIEGERARNHLLEANLRLVVALAKRYQGKGLALLDLIQEGNIGLAHAVEMFDYTKGYKFSTYATWWIRQALQRAIADQGRSLRVSVHMAETIKQTLRAKRDLATILGREPTHEELGQELGKTPDQVEKILGYSQDTISLEAPVGEDGTVFGDFIEDVDITPPEDIADFSLLQDRLRAVLGTLPEISVAVMEMRFGLKDGHPRTQKEVSELLGITSWRVHRIERTALTNLRRSEAAASLKAWL